MTPEQRLWKAWENCNHKRERAQPPCHLCVANQIRAAIAEEREACAFLADIEHENAGDSTDTVLTRLAKAIRARGDAEFPDVKAVER